MFKWAFTYYLLLLSTNLVFGGVDFSGQNRDLAMEVNQDKLNFIAYIDDINWQVLRSDNNLDLKFMFLWSSILRELHRYLDSVNDVRKKIHRVSDEKIPVERLKTIKELLGELNKVSDDKVKRNNKKLYAIVKANMTEINYALDDMIDEAMLNEVPVFKSEKDARDWANRVTYVPKLERMLIQRREELKESAQYIKDKRDFTIFEQWNYCGIALHIMQQYKSYGSEVYCGEEPIVTRR